MEIFAEHGLNLHKELAMWIRKIPPKGGAPKVPLRRLGGTSAYVLLGPDLSGNARFSRPSVRSPAWDRLCDVGGWVRGHLINDNWGGPGDTWRNLTPLTSVANHNHSTVEERMKKLVDAFRAFDVAKGEMADYWYGLQYWIQVSDQSMIDSDELRYSCPRAIRVTWRVVKIKRPEEVFATPGKALASIRTQLSNVGSYEVPAPSELDKEFKDHWIRRDPIPPRLPGKTTEAKKLTTFRSLPAGAPPLPPSPLNQPWSGQVTIFQK